MNRLNKKIELLEIETPRLILREWTMADAGRIVEILNIFDVAKHLTTTYPFTLEDAYSYINRDHVTSPEGERINLKSFACELKTDGKVIGGMVVPFISERKLVEDGGIWLDPKYHGKGFGTEIFNHRAKYCFDALGAKIIKSGFFEGNEPSWKMQEKIGFKLTGKKEELTCPAIGTQVFNVETILRKEDFKEQKCDERNT